MSAEWDQVKRKLDDLATGQARLSGAIESLDQQVARLADQVQRIAETSTRLKLMAGNARQSEERRDETLQMIEERLGRIEGARSS